MMVAAEMRAYDPPSLNHGMPTWRLGRPEPGKACTATHPKKGHPAPTKRSYRFSNPPLGRHWLLRRHGAIRYHSSLKQNLVHNEIDRSRSAPPPLAVPSSLCEAWSLIASDP